MREDTRRQNLWWEGPWRPGMKQGLQKEQAHFARSDTFRTTSDRRAGAAPWPRRARRGTHTCKKRLLETLAAAPKHEHNPAKKWKGNSKWQMKTNILGGCVVVTDSFIWATRERVTVAGTSFFLTHHALEHGEVSPTGRETGSELPTMANRDLIRSEPSQELLVGIIVKGCSMQEKAHASETMNSTRFLTKLKLERLKLSTYLYYRSCCNAALLGNGYRTAAGTTAVPPCTIVLRGGCHLNENVPTSYMTPAYAEENNHHHFS